MTEFGVGEVEGVQVLDAEAARRWADLLVAALAEDRDALDRINVYPVADGDTGTNLLHTMRSAVAAVESAAPTQLSGVLDALARGAVTGARGNSGMLLSQVLRGIAERVRGVLAMDGHALRAALQRAEELARAAVVEPMDGTLLSVLHAAVEAAQRSGSAALDVVVRAATEASVRALEQTTTQLRALTEAGVVDAGGRGLVVVLDSLHAVVHGGRRLASAAPASPAAVVDAAGADSGFGYEVMYLLGEPVDGGIDRLRAVLAGLGDCVSVVGDGAGVWAVHVHCDDVGRAIESGIEIGRVHQIRVTRFLDQCEASGECGGSDERVASTPESAPPTNTGQTVLACVRSAGVAELFESEGARVLVAPVDRAPNADDLSSALTEVAASTVVLLSNDERTLPVVEEAAARAVRSGVDAVVVPTASPVQGLAALAVHDPRRRAAENIVAMAEAAAATRRGELVLATGEALTWAGRCHPGDVLGLADGDVVVIRKDLDSAARDLVDRMVAPGGELVTLLVDPVGAPGLAEAVAEHLHRVHPEIEFNCFPTRDLWTPALIGVE